MRRNIGGAKFAERRRRDAAVGGGVVVARGRTRVCGPSRGPWHGPAGVVCSTDAVIAVVGGRCRPWGRRDALNTERVHAEASTCEVTTGRY